MLRVIHHMFVVADELRPAPWIAALLLPVLLLLIPPNGVLNDNEEHYFAMAHHTVSPDETVPNGTISEGMPHAFVFEHVAGAMIDVFGYEGTQVAGRLLVAALFAVALAALASALEIGALTAITAVLLFWLSGQELIGGEWLFRGIEPKTLAYPFVILGLAAVLRDRLWQAYLFLAVATYLHFLAGGFWAVLCAGALLLQQAAPRRVGKVFGLYLLLISPLIVELLVRGYGQIAISATSSADAGPSVSSIVTRFRSPHHATPFLRLSDFVEWLPGICLLFAITALSLSTVRHVQNRTRLLAVMVATTGLYLIAALVITAFDRQASLGPFTLFRPSSLMLLAAILLGLVTLTRLAGGGAQSLRIAAFVLIAALALPLAVVDSARPVRSQRALLAAQEPLFNYVRAMPAGASLFLIEPGLEREMLSFERRTGRPLFVLNKFVPSTERGMQEWYRRRLIQDGLFAGGCAAKPAPVTHLIVSRPVAEQLASCGTIVFEQGRFAIIRTTTVASNSHD